MLGDRSAGKDWEPLSTGPGFSSSSSLSLSSASTPSSRGDCCKDETWLGGMSLSEYGDVVHDCMSWIARLASGLGGSGSSRRGRKAAEADRATGLNRRDDGTNRRDDGKGQVAIKTSSFARSS